MEQVVLPIALFSARSLAEFSYSLLEHCIAPCEGVRSAWVTLIEEVDAPSRMAACLQREGAAAHITANVAFPLLLPVEISRIRPLPQTVPQTFQASNSEYPVTLFPFVFRAQCFGHLVVRWRNAPAAAVVHEMETTLTALSALLYSYHRESLFADLERGKQQWEATFDSMRDLLFIYDTQGKLLRVNRALAERLGATPREVMLKPQMFYRVFGEAAEACRNAPIWRSSLLESAFEATCGLAYNRQKEPIGNVYILRDITDKEKLETQMRQSAKLAELGEMVSRISHELNQRLTSIVGFAELLESGAIALPEAALNRVHKLAAEADRAEAFVKDLLSFARPRTPVQQAVDLNRVAKRVVECRAQQAANHCIALKMRLDDYLPMIKSCPHEMEQVLLNLVDNAIHAISSHKQGGVIVIATRYEGGDRLSMTVTDDGCGILPELREKILLPFFTTKPAGEGSGLGLAITHNILRSHAATLKIHSEMGRGSAFVMDFPVMTQLLTQDPISEAAVSAKSSQKKLSGLSIAILDDDSAVLELLADMLREMGHSPSQFSAPSSLLSAMEERDFDIIFSDMWMPEMSGADLHREVMQRFPQYANRYALLTGDAVTDVARTALQRRGCAFVEKPFRLADLESAIESLMRCEKDVRKAA